MLKTDLLQTTTELEQRRSQALNTAEMCMQVLKNLGASEVFICGSLAGETPWHWYSDLDLAILGLSQDQVWAAHTAIKDLSPSWLEVDLIPLEFAPEHLRDRILSKVPMADNKYSALKLRIDDEMDSLTITVNTVSELLKQQGTIPEIALVPALTSYIADFYNGCERISERVAVYLDEGIPKSKDWHLELLMLMAEPGGSDRPPLWSGSLLLKLSHRLLRLKKTEPAVTVGEYRKFRHLTRHIYKVELDRDRVIALGEDVEVVFGKIKLAVESFIQWLEVKSKSPI
jgi:hypothetical protein